VTRLIPIEELFALPAFSSWTLSPDGTRLAYLAPAYGHLNVWVRGVDQEHADAVLVTHSRTRSIPGFQWTSDPRWMLFRQDTDGNEDWHWFRIDLDNPEAEPVDLTPLPPGARVVGAGEEDGKVVAVMNPRYLFFDTFDIDLLTGETTLVSESSDILSNYSDVRGNQGFFTTQAADGTLEVYAVDDKATGAMRLVHSEDGPSFPTGQFPIHFSLDHSEMYLGSYWGGSDDLRLIRIDHASGDISVVAERPGSSVDVMGVYSHDVGRPPSIITSARTGKLLAVRFVGDRPEMVPVDAEFAEVHAELMKLADGGELGWVTSDHDEQVWTVTFLHDRRDGLSYLYDHRTRTSTLLHDPGTVLDPAELAEMRGVRFTARDGLPLHAFLTLPVGVEPKNLPLVVKVHGGPWLNDMWWWNSEVQLLANRGYAVLQVNYRASTGYGQRHIKAGMREYGGKMNDDLIDACEWAVGEGIADPTRLGIFGTSQGGYMTLVAVATTPDYFAAAVDDVGFSSIPALLGDHPDWIKSTQRNNFIAYCGDTSNHDDLADMLSRSPVTMLDKITTPLLVIAGAQDTRVRLTEHEAIVNGLRERGVDVGYLVADNEGHGFVRPENINRMWHLVEEHFARHLGGRKGPTG
jgi:dipeptidyl aminopeptidase/acylaminoacyl peptidase